MSMNQMPALTRLHVLAFIRKMIRTSVIVCLAFWSAYVHANFALINPGTYMLSDSIDRLAIDQPIQFARGPNPVETTHPDLVRWWVPWWPHAEAWSDVPRIPGRIAIVHGLPHSVFAIPGLPSIGYVLDVRDPTLPTWLPINDKVVPPSTKPGYKTTRVIPDGAHGYCCSAGLSIRLTFIKIDHQPIHAGTPVFFSIDQLVSFHVLHNRTRLRIRPPMHARLTFGLQKITSSCKLTSTATQSIKLPDVSKKAFQTVGSTYAGNDEARFTLQCEPGTTVFATLTDANNPSNVGDTLTNTGSAKGMGIQLLQTSPSFSNRNCANGTPCKFGPDARIQGNTNQWQVGPDNSANMNTTNASIAFRAQYIRTGTIQPGTVRAVSTITFSYQ